MKDAIGIGEARAQSVAIALRFGDASSGAIAAAAA
jgi:hypothetical protein